MTPPNPSLVWLFDIDGTLLLTRGAGRDALVRGFRECHGIEDDLRDIPFAGRTDLLIVRDVAARHGLTLDDAELAGLFRSVAAHMRVLMDPPRGALLPGVSSLLEEVAREPGWVSALLTGNESEMARIKLSAFGVHERFAWGTFGEEAPDRDALARLAVRRAAECHGVTPRHCVVVGDTEHDVACARAAGAHVVAVATGSVPRPALEACGPDLVLDDLRDTHALLEWARSLPPEPANARAARNGKARG